MIERGSFKEVKRAVTLKHLLGNLKIHTFIKHIQNYNNKALYKVILMTTVLYE